MEQIYESVISLNKNNLDPYEIYSSSGILGSIVPAEIAKHPREKRINHMSIFMG